MVMPFKVTAEMVPPAVKALPSTTLGAAVACTPVLADALLIAAAMAIALLTLP